jgi:nitroimidazol reductase NimA-like FMN-containing flavoprotein (pyridoxamine 5'-phosphate oxidase superfamily)
MTNFMPSSRLEEIGREECLELLARKRVGRVAVVDGEQPYIFPVNYAIDGETVVFRTAAGTKLDLSSWAKVAFEVDEIDDSNESGGWDVLVVGRAADITSSLDARAEELRHLDIDPWAPGLKDHFVRIVPTEVTGRRLVRY